MRYVDEAAYFTKHAFPARANGGAVVNVASIRAVETSPMVAPYAAAKAVMSPSRTASIEGKARTIRVNAVLPGAIHTPMLWNNPNVESGAEVVSPHDVGKPQEIAAAAAFLGSDDAGFVTAAALVVDGGRLAKL